MGHAKDVRDVLPEAEGKKGKSRRTSWEIRIDNFDHTIRHITYACSLLPQVDVPKLDSKRRSQALADLRTAGKHIQEATKTIQHAEEVEATEPARPNKLRQRV